MRKLQSYMIALICTGVFAAGLGPGITYSEFSSFASLGDESEEAIVADDSGPRGIIRFQVTYNAAAVRPYVEYSEGSYVGIGSYDRSDDFERFMRNIDLFLKDLKARQLHSYKSAGITQIKVLVHPEDRDMLRLP